jgi:hypothetical protein
MSRFGTFDQSGAANADDEAKTIAAEINVSVGFFIMALLKDWKFDATRDVQAGK